MIESKLTDQGVDAVITVSMLDIEEEQRYVPGSTGYRPQTYFDPFYNYFFTTYNLVYAPGYYTNSTEVFTESNLFDLEANKVIWSGQSRTYDPSTVGNFADDLAKTVIKSMDESQVL